MFKKIKWFLKDENGDSVIWLVLIIIGIVLAVIIFNGLKDHVKNAAQNLGNALEGK
jgi:Flp pilus assembly pilin Flp